MDSWRVPFDEGVWRGTLTLRFLALARARALPRPANPNRPRIDKNKIEA
jgi:hypothetical protein